MYKKTIYYHELRISAKRGRDSLTFSSWIITRLNENKIIQAIKKDNRLQMEVLKNRFKKKAENIMKTVKEFNVEIIKTIRTNE
jgi:hypothetical protein